LAEHIPFPVCVYDGRLYYFCYSHILKFSFTHS
jgi:YHS domain-containing protein